MKWKSFGILSFSFCIVLPALAEIAPLKGPVSAEVGDMGQLQVPAGYVFVEKKDCKEFMEKTNNLYSGTEMGVLISEDEKKGYWAFFEFEDIGYIKDAAQEKLDADAMWTSMVKNGEKANKARVKKGWPTMDIVRWEKKPEYNPQTQRLEWAQWLKTDGKEFINFNTRLLGRRGVMRVTLVPSGDTPLQNILPEFNQVISQFQYKSGHKYAEWTKGDKIAKYGLAALVVGGAGTLAVKSGLLGKIWKLLVVAVVGLFAFLKNFWNKITGRKTDEQKPY